MWVGSRRIVDDNPGFTPEVDVALREYRGPGLYWHTGEMVGKTTKTLTQDMLAKSMRLWLKIIGKEEK